MLRTTALFLLAASAGVASATSVSATFDRPSTDIWNYPFNFNFAAGDRPAGSTFGSFGDPMFDERDAEILTLWTTAGQIAPGLGVDKYEVTGATLTFTSAASNPVAYDPTQDDVSTYGLDATVADADAGRPLELFGAGFRNGVSPFAYPGAPFAFGPPLPRTRNAFPVDVSSGAPRDVSNNVTDGFNPAPFAVGTTTTLNPGDFITTGDVFTFDIDVNDAAIENYLAEGLNTGLLAFTLTSLQPTVQGGNTFQAFTLDVPGAAPPTAGAPTLALEVTIIPEPATSATLALALAAAATRSRRRLA